MNKALVQVLGAVAYGELKAYEGAKAEAEAATDPAVRLRYRTVAAEELRHHKGFVARLEAMGADPERAMAPFRAPLDRYHGRVEADPVDAAVFGYLGEGVADDLLQWLRTVVDDETATFIDTVIEDEVGHEADAAADLRAVLATEPDGPARAARASRKMLTHMLWSGRQGAAPLVAFVRLGRPDALVRALLGGHTRRMRSLGLEPFGLGFLRVLPKVTATAALGPAELATFREDGFVVVADLFDAQECDEITRHVEDAAFELALGEQDDGPLSYRPMMHLASDPLTAVATDPRWQSIVLPLLGTGDARLYWEQAVAKPPQARTELPWHQDNGYTPLIPEEYVTCWLALDDAEVDNGCLWVIPRSHREGTISHHGGPGPFRVGHDGPASDGVPVPIRRGSVLVFSSLLMHRSGPNVTDRPRRAWILQYCGAAARSALSGKVLDDRLLCAADGAWLDEPVRQREFDLIAVLANYDHR